MGSLGVVGVKGVVGSREWGVKGWWGQGWGSTDWWRSRGGGVGVKGVVGV